MMRLARLRALSSKFRKWHLLSLNLSLYENLTADVEQVRKKVTQKCKEKLQTEINRTIDIERKQACVRSRILYLTNYNTLEHQHQTGTLYAVSQNDTRTHAFEPHSSNGLVTWNSPEWSRVQRSRSQIEYVSCSH